LRFTVRRPSIGEVSPCGHRPSGGDVACSVDVGVAPPGSAGFALEDRSALAVSECDAPARGASLRRVRSRDLLDPAESLVLQARDGNTAVDAHHAAIAWTGDRVGDVRERDMPAASPIPGNPVGFHTRWHRPRQAESHPPDLRHPHPTEAAVQPLDVTPFHRDLPKPFMHTGFTPPRAAMRAGEEVPHGLREIPQRLLLHRLTSGPKPRVLGARRGQLRGLLQIPGRVAARLPVLLLLHRQIPHIPRVSAVRQQCLLLLNGRQQSKPRHIRTLATDTDISRPRATVPVVIGFLELKSRASSPKETSMRRKRAAFCSTDVISAVERSSCRARREGQSK
jgi:hypothetical protein